MAKPLEYASLLAFSAMLENVGSDALSWVEPQGHKSESNGRIAAMLDPAGMANMSVYMIIDSRIKDRGKYQQYIDRVSPIVTKHGGRYHVRGGKIKSFGTWKPERIIIIEFPTEEHIQRWLTSSEYRAIAPLREGGADTEAILVDGIQEESHDIVTEIE